jgi:hypothetical protein
MARARQTLTSLLHEDLIGIFILVAGLCLFLLPIPLEQGGVSQYASARLVVPTVIGFLITVAFVFWELRFAKRPLLPVEVFTNRTLVSVLGGTCFLSSRLLVPPADQTGLANTVLVMGMTVGLSYFFTFLMVGSDFSVSNGTYISMILSLLLQLMGVVYGAVVIRFRRIKWILLLGLGLHLVGRGIQYAFPDPETQLGGLIASQILAGIGSGVSIHFLTVMQAVVDVKGQ